MAAAETKTCPHCAEDMKTQARVCPHCGREFYTQAKARRMVIVGLVIVVVFGIASVLAFQNFAAKVTPTTTTPTTARRGP